MENTIEFAASIYGGGRPPFTTEELDAMKMAIEKMNKYQQIEILKILTETSSKVNENKSGVFVNLSLLAPEVLRKLHQYVHYTKDQNENLDTIEYQKAEFKQSFFTEKENKDNPILYYSTVSK
jgi:hypothetical protein